MSQSCRRSLHLVALIFIRQSSLVGIYRRSDSADDFEFGAGGERGDCFLRWWSQRTRFASILRIPHLHTCPYPSCAGKPGCATLGIPASRRRRSESLSWALKPSPTTLLTSSRRSERCFQCGLEEAQVPWVHRVVWRTPP